MKQCVVCPIPVGSTFSPSRALIRVDLPLEVRPKKTTWGGEVWWLEETG